VIDLFYPSDEDPRFSHAKTKTKTKPESERIPAGCIKYDTGKQKSSVSPKILGG